MARSSTLFDDDAKYSIDTNVILSFLHDHDSEWYPADVFKREWGFIEAAMSSGKIIAARQVEVELAKWQKTVPVMKPWLRNHKCLFCDIDSNLQLAGAKQVVNAYPAYASSQNYLGDLEVITLAMARSLTVISQELRAQQHSPKRPKVPDVCHEFGIGCMTIAGFLRAEGFAD